METYFIEKEEDKGDEMDKETAKVVFTIISSYKLKE
jgi:hypothetical protein